MQEGAGSTKIEEGDKLAAGFAIKAFICLSHATQIALLSAIFFSLASCVNIQNLWNLFVYYESIKHGSGYWKRQGMEAAMPLAKFGSVWFLCSLR